MGDTGIQLWLFCCVTIICNFVWIKQQNRLSLILAQRMSKYQKIIKAAISELFLRPRPFGIVESSYYKDQWLGYDRYLWDKMVLMSSSVTRVKGQPGQLTNSISVTQNVLSIWGQDNLGSPKGNLGIAHNCPGVVTPLLMSDDLWLPRTWKALPSGSETSLLLQISIDLLP